MFSALSALVVHPFDYPESDRLAQVWSGEGWPLSPADFFDLHDQSTSFESFGVYTPEPVNVGAEDAQVVDGVNATTGVLDAYGVRPARGRWLEAGDTVEGAPKVAVIGHGLWQDAYAGDPQIVGRAVRLNGGDVTVRPTESSATCASCRTESPRCSVQPRPLVVASSYSISSRSALPSA